MYPIGYVAKQSRIYCADKSVNLISYSLDLSIINYQTAILRGDLDAAAQILPKIPMDQKNRIAQFLEKQGYPEMALQIATDSDLKFELALQLNKLSTAYGLAKEANSEEKWKLLGDIGLKNGEIGLARECLINAQDLGGLLTLCTACGDSEALTKVAQKAREDGLYNVAFASYFTLGRINDCLDLLCEVGRIPEAAFLARSYMPSKVSEIVKLWREDLKSVSVKAAESLADPDEYPNLFSDLEFALKAEKYLASRGPRRAADYLQEVEHRNRDFIQEIREGTLDVNAQIEMEESRGADSTETHVEETKEEATEDEPTQESSEIVNEETTETPQEETQEEEEAQESTKEAGDSDLDLDVDVDDIISDFDGKDIDLEDIDIDDI